ncbi:HEAT repeat domain-containing protein [Gimesia panareensis]|uniref:HEAT repeat domain-containing protein n=1 Tax=Gimesia panareensis TaxID=2527978 RepID=UPI0011895E8F|nr:HEAT repeat domain-containing protein [Gimesia panareensis]QDU47911.1 Thioredoxin C-1 [Gimesia panareensis]
MYQKTGWLIGLILLVGCGEQPKPVEQTQTTPSQTPPRQAKPEPASAQEPVTQTEKTAPKKEDSDGDDYVERVVAEHQEKTFRRSLSELKSNDRDQRVMAVAMMVTSKIDPNRVVAGLLNVVDDKDEQVAGMSRKYIQSHTFKSKGQLVDFYADWCGPCRMMKPVVKELQEEGYPVIQVDVDQNPDLSSHFYISSIPTFALIVDGSMRQRRIGVVDKSELLKLLKEIPQEDQKDKEKAYVTDPKLKVYGALVTMQSENPWYRYEARQQLGQASLPTLIQILRDPGQRSVFRESVMQVLESFMKSEAQATEIVKVMSEIMNDPEESEELRGMAVLFLSRHDPARSGTLDEKLVALLKASRPEALQADVAEEIGNRKIKQGLPVLIEKVKHLDQAPEEIRIAYLSALGQFGAAADAAVPALLAAYPNFPDESADISETLEQICPDSKAATQVLIKTLTQDDEDSRSLAVSLLDQAEYITTASSSLQKLLNDPDPEVSLKAAKLLEKIGGSDQKIVSALVKQLDAGDLDWEIRSALRTAWRYSYPALIKIICDSQSAPQAKVNAMSLLRDFSHVPDPGEQASLEAALEQENKITKQCAAIVLSSSPSQKPQIVLQLLEALQAKNSLIRQQAPQALGHRLDSLSQEQQDQAKATLMKLLNDSDSQVSEAAGAALAHYELSEDELKGVIGSLKNPELQYPVVSILTGQKMLPASAIQLLCDQLAGYEIDEGLANQISTLLISAGKPALGGLEAVASNAELDPDRRAKVVLALGEMTDENPEVVKYLKELLKQKQPQPLQIAAAIALAETVEETESLIPLLLTGLQSENWEMKQAAGDVLRRVVTASPDTLKQVLTKLEDLEQDEQNEVILDLSREESLRKQLRPQLHSLILDMPAEKNLSQCRTAIGYLVQGTEAGTEITRLLAEPDQDIVQQTLMSLVHSREEIPESVLSELEPFLKSSNRTTSLLAALCLLKAGSGNDALLTIVRGALESDNGELVERAGYGLEMVGSLDEKWVPVLINLLNNRDHRRAAIEQLGRMGPAAKSAVPALMDLLDTVSYYEETASALGELGQTAAEAVPALREKLKNERTMYAAAQALEKIEQDHQPTIEILGQNLDQPDLRGDTAYTLGVFAPKSPDQIEPLLLKVASSESVYDRGMAIRAAGHLKSKAVVEMLIKALDENDREISEPAARALGNLGIEAELAVPALMKSMEVPNERVQFAAAQALGSFGAAAQPAVPALLKALDEKSICLAAASSLGRIGAPAQEAIPRLIKMLDEPAQRRAALRGLKQFGPLAKQAVPSLKKLEQQSNGYERLQLETTLKAIQAPEAQQ